MCGLGVLRLTVSQYESKSVTQREAERSPGPQAYSGKSICSYARGLELAAGRAGYTQIAGFRAARALLSGLIPWRCDRRSGVPLPLWRSLQPAGKPATADNAPLPSADLLGWLAGSRKSPADHLSAQSAEYPAEDRQRRTSDRDESHFSRKTRPAPH